MRYSLHFSLVLVRTVLLLSKVRHTAELIIRATSSPMENLILRSLSRAICSGR